MKLNSIGLLPNFREEEFALVEQLLAENGTQADLREFRSGLLARLSSETDDGELYLLDSARSSFYFYLKSLKLPAGSEVILPSFTCVVVVNPVLWNSAKPVYVDIDPGNFNSNFEGILAKVNANTKVILAQHTFGAIFPVAQLKARLKEMGREDILIVEDLAHILGMPGFELQGDAAILTFGLEKAISTLRGGALWVRNHSLGLEYENLSELDSKLTTKFLKNAIFWRAIIPHYYLGIGPFTFGRIAAQIARFRGLIGIAIEKEEYSSGKPGYLPTKMPRSLAKLGNLQLEKLAELNQQRLRLAKLYSAGITETTFADNPEQKFIREVIEESRTHGFLRYPLVLKSQEQRLELISQAKRAGFVLGDWYKTPLYTKLEYLDIFSYEKSDYPVNEQIRKRIVNLPTSIVTSEEDVAKLLSIIKNVDA